MTAPFLRNDNSNPQPLLSVGLYLLKDMDKKERYYNFIVDDMVKKTEIDHDKKRIKFPSLPISISFLSLLFPLPPLFLSLFSKHVIERYGVHDEEMEIIWNLYKERIQSLIKKYE
tara:strand:- start:47 stop:391 length:345 start_codon:yes stop_codon:yes gene_type:complete